jgi:D-hydroxyproline dehydrogenase subunit gamma
MPDTLSIRVNGRELRVPAGTILAVALARAGETRFRRSASGESRGPLCGMGVCFECRVTVDGRPHVRSCQLVCEDGMDVKTDE